MKRDDAEGSVPDDDARLQNPTRCVFTNECFPFCRGALSLFCSLSVGSKKDRQGCDVLTLMLQALQSIVASEALPAARVLVRPPS